MRKTLLFLAALALTEARDAHALRPFIAASDAGIVEPGEVEVELGAGFARNTRRGAGETALELPSLEFNIGVARNLEVGIGTGFELVRERTEEGGRRTLGSAGETSVKSKIRFFQGEAGQPSLTTELTLTLPAQRREFLPGNKRAVNFDGVLISTIERGPSKVHFNVGGGLTRSRRGDAAGVFLWAIAGELNVAERLWLVSEFRGAAARRSLPDNTALGGLIWESPWGVKFDIAGFGGLSRGAPNGGGVMGLTWTFPALF